MSEGSGALPGRATLAVTLGDVRGVGPEVVVRALSHREVRGAADFLVVGPRGAWAAAREWVGGGPGEARQRAVAECGLTDPRFSGLEVCEVRAGRRPGETARGGPPVELRQASEAQAGAWAGASVEAGVHLVQAGQARGLVTAPLDKAALAAGGYPYPGHTEMLQALTGARSVAMMLVGGSLRVTLATIHLPLARVPGELTTERILSAIRLTQRALRGPFGLIRTRIGVAALNPHAGERGLFGREEEETVRPAVEGARREGMEIEGPLPADTLFHRAARGEFDAVIALYHDQGLIPLKLHAFRRAVNVTLGLPFVRTSVDHGTAPDIAWTGRADEGSCVHAILLAARMARRLQVFDTNSPPY